MGSGSFPLERTDGDAVVLLDIVEKLEYITSMLRDSVYSGDSGGCQFDNAASDGAYLEDLRVARELIEKCVKKEK